MDGADHEEVLRLRERMHELSNETARQIGRLTVKVEVTDERVKNLADEVHGLKRALWAFVFSVLSGAIIFLLTIVTGTVGGGP